QTKSEPGYDLHDDLYTAVQDQSAWWLASDSSVPLMRARRTTYMAEAGLVFPCRWVEHRVGLLQVHQLRVERKGALEFAAGYHEPIVTQLVDGRWPRFEPSERAFP